MFPVLQKKPDCCLANTRDLIRMATVPIMSDIKKSATSQSPKWKNVLQVKRFADGSEVIPEVFPALIAAISSVAVLYKASVITLPVDYI